MSGTSTYDAAAALAVCERLEREPQLSLSEILRQAGIARTTFRDWRNAHPELMAAYKEAKAEGYDNLARRARMTARGKGEDAGGDSTGDVQRDKLIIDTDLKLLAKWDGRYADRQVLAGDPDAPIAVQTVTRRIIRPT